MNIEARKIEFIQEFLKLQSEDAISKLEKILKMAVDTDEEQFFKPMTIDDLHKRIDKSEMDFKNNRFKSSSELLSKYE
jgi:hypothetical protein